MTAAQTTGGQYTELHRFLQAINEPVDAIWTRFWDWHLLHPSVAGMLFALAVQARQRGLKRYGIGAIWEVMRWHIVVKEGKTEEFKCSNDYRSRFARFLMWQHEELAGFFELRPLRSRRGREWE